MNSQALFLTTGVNRSIISNARIEGENFQKLWLAIHQNDSPSFRKILQNMEQDKVLSYLFSEDELRQTPIMLISQQQIWLDFMAILNEWSKKNCIYVRQIMSIVFSEESLKHIAKCHYERINRIVVNKLIKEKNEENISKAIEILSNQNCLYMILFKQFFSFYSLITCLPKSEQQQQRILRCFYLPMSRMAQSDEEGLIRGKITMIKKRRIWEIQQKQYVDYLNEPDLLILKNLNYNILHQLACRKQISAIFQLIQLLRPEPQNNCASQLLDLFHFFNISGETPTDIILGNWPKKQLYIFLQQIKNIPELQLSVNCLNKILENKYLNKNDVEELIIYLLDGTKSTHGFRVQIKQYNKCLLKSLFIRERLFNSNSVITTDKFKILSAKWKQRTYPLLGYLTKYQQNCCSEIFDRLLFKSISKKYVKKMYSGILKNFYKKQQEREGQLCLGRIPNQFHVGWMSEGYKMCEQFEFYLNPLLQEIVRIKNHAMVNILADKILFNYMFIQCHWQGKLVKIKPITNHFILLWLNSKQPETQSSIQLMMKILENLRSLETPFIRLIVLKIQRQRKLWDRLPRQLKDFVKSRIMKWQSVNKNSFYERVCIYPTQTQQIIEEQYQNSQQDTIENKKSQAIRDYQLDKSVQNLKHYLELIEPYERRSMYLTLGSDLELDQKIDLLFKYGVDFKIKIRPFLQQPKAELEKIKNPVWKQLLSTMLQCYLQQSQISFSEAFFCCSEQSTMSIVELIKNNVSFGKLFDYKDIWRLCTKKVKVNYLLCYHLYIIDQIMRKNDEDPDIQGYFYTFRKYQIRMDGQKKTQQTIRNIFPKLFQKGPQFIQKQPYMIWSDPTLLELIKGKQEQLIFDYLIKQQPDSTHLLALMILSRQNPIKKYQQILPRLKSRIADYNKAKLNNKEYNQEELQTPDEFCQQIMLDLLPQKINKIQRQKYFENYLIKTSLEDFENFVFVTGLYKHVVRFRYIKQMPESKWLTLFQLSQSDKLYNFCLLKKYLPQSHYPTIRLALVALDYFFNDKWVSRKNRDKWALNYYYYKNIVFLGRKALKALSQYSEKQFSLFLDFFANLLSRYDLELAQDNLSRSISFLLWSHHWARVEKVLQMKLPHITNFLNQILQFVIDNQKFGLSNFTNLAQYNRLINKVYQILSSKRIKQEISPQKLIRNLFLVNPQKCLQIYGHIFSAEAKSEMLIISKFFRENPQLQLSFFQKYELDHLRSSISSIWFKKPGYHKYIIELLRLQFSQNTTNLHLLKLFFMHPDVRKHPHLFLHTNQIQAFSDMIFMKREIISLNQIPKQYIDAYLQRHKNIVRNCHLINTQLLISIIENNLNVDLWDLIRTCNMKIIKQYLAKHNISILSNPVSNKFLSIWQFKSESFIIDCINQFDLIGLHFDNLGEVLEIIALQRKIKVLQILINYINGFYPNIEFDFVDEYGTKCGIINEKKLNLPKFITQHNHFYEYYFLAKLSQNHTKIKFTHPSPRYDLIDNKVDQLFQIYDFLPQMQIRLIFYKEINSLEPSQSSHLLLSILLGVQCENYSLFASAINSIPLDCKKIHEAYRTQKYSMAYIIFNHPEKIISRRLIPHDYCRLIEVVKKVEELFPIKLENLEAFNYEICHNIAFYNGVLQTNPQFFKKNCNQELVLEKCLQYVSGFIHNFQFWECQSNQQFTEAFIKNWLNYDTTINNQGQLTLNHIVVVCLLSHYEGNGKIYQLILQNLHIQSSNDLYVWVSQILNALQKKPTINSFWDYISDKINEIIGGKPLKHGQLNIKIESPFGNAENILKRSVQAVPTIKQAVCVLRNVFYLEAEYSIIQENLQKLQIYKKIENQLTLHLLLDSSPQSPYSIKNNIFYIPFLINEKGFIMLETNIIIEELRKSLFISALIQLGPFQIKDDKLISYTIDPQSFKSSNTSVILEDIWAIANKQPSTPNTISINSLILKLETLSQKYQQLLKGYTFSDVDGPININDLPNHKDKAVDMLAFYSILKSSAQLVVLRYHGNNNMAQNLNMQPIDDIREYIEYFKDEISNDEQTQVRQYKFNNQIWLGDSENIYDGFHWNSILEILVAARLFGELIRARCDQTNIQVCIPSLIEMGTLFASEAENGKAMISKMFSRIFSQHNIDLINQILDLTIFEAYQKINPLKGVLIRYKKLEPSEIKDDITPYSIDHKIFVYEVRGLIDKSIFVVELLYTEREPSQGATQSIEESRILTDERFLDQIFPISSKALFQKIEGEEYYFHYQLIQISKSLSSYANTHINFHINYSTIDGYIKRFRQRHSRLEVQTLIKCLKEFILSSLHDRVIKIKSQKKFRQIYSIKLHNKLESIYRSIPFEDVMNEQQLEHKYTEDNQQSLIQQSHYLVEVFSDQGITKPFFLIKMPKEYMKSIISQEMTFVSYNLEKIPAADFEDRDDQTIYLLSNDIPNNEAISHSQITQILISDSINVYQPYKQLHEKLLSNPISIPKQLPFFQPNITLLFKQSAADCDLAFVNDQSNRYLTINLTDNFQFTYQQQPKPKQLTLNSMLKRNSTYNELINNFIESIGYTFKLDLKISTVSNLTTDSFIEFIRWILDQLREIFDIIIKEPQIVYEIQKYASFIEQFSFKNNYIKQSKTQLLMKTFKAIKIAEVGAEHANACFEGTVLNLKANKDQYYQSSFPKLIFETIIWHLIKSNAPKTYKICQMKDHSIRIFQYIACAQFQQLAIKRAFKIAQQILPQNRVPKFYQCNILSEHSTLTQNKDTLVLNLSTTSISMKFFSQSEILEFLHDNESSRSITNPKTKYLEQQSQIIIEDYWKGSKIQLILVRADGKISKKDEEIDKRKSTNKTGFIKCSNIDQFERYFVKQCLNGRYQFYDEYFYHPPNNLQSITKEVKLIKNQQIDLYLSGDVLRNFKNSQSYFTIKKQRKANSIFDCDYCSWKFINSTTVMMSLRIYQTTKINFVLKDLTLLNNRQLSKFSIFSISDKKMKIKNTMFTSISSGSKYIPIESFKSFMEQEKQQLLAIQQPLSEQILKKFNISSSSFKYLTKAGAKRIDQLQVYDEDYEQVKCEEPQKLKICFKHEFSDEKIIPQVIEAGLKIKLEWTPILKGPYRLLINNINIPHNHIIGVHASDSGLKICEVQKPQLPKQIPYGKQFTVKYKIFDQFGNIFTDSEYAKYKNLFSVKTDTINVDPTHEHRPMNKSGLKSTTFRFSSSQSTSEFVSFKFEVSIAQQQVLSHELKMKTISLQYKIKQLQKELQTYVKDYKRSIEIDRNQFLQELIQLAKRSLLTNFQVKFKREPGIDCGGPRREFYDMIGEQIKSESNNFFECIDQKNKIYFLNPKILRNKKSKEYMKLIGKYIGNSIVNQYLLGVNFSYVLIKMLYGETLTKEQKMDALPTQDAKSYRQILKETPENIECLCLTFTVQDQKKKWINLVKDGDKKEVTVQNVEEYIEKSVDYLVNRFKELIAEILDGFNSVFPLGVVKKYISFEQFWVLTNGTKGLTSQRIIKQIVFRGGNDNVKTLFRRYISECSTEKLEDFLKFSTGSSAISFSKNNTVTVSFIQRNPKKLLSFSHSCFLTIDVPQYKDYEEMKKYMDISIEEGKRGFSNA